MERGIQRALADLQCVVRDLLDALRNAPACIGSKVTVFKMSRSSVPCRRSVGGGMFPSAFNKRMNPLLSNVKGDVPGR
jgi:hypothetical protein